MFRDVKKFGITLAMFCAAATPGWSQEQPTTERQAEIHFRQYEYARAAYLYERLAKKRNVKTQVLARLAESYRKMNGYADAAHWYSQLKTRPDAPPDAGLHYADMLKSQGRYEQAKAAYLQLIQDNSSGPMLVSRIAGCDSALHWMNLPKEGSVENTVRLNTTRSDWAAAWYRKSIVFVSDSARTSLLKPGSRMDRNLYGWNKHQFLKLYRADTLQYGQIYLSDLSPAFNRYKYHVGPVTFDSAFQTAYFTVTNAEQRPGGDRERLGNGLVTWRNRRLELMISKKDSAGNWGEAIPFPYNNPAEHSTGHAALSVDGKTLYYASDRPGGLGGTDIWYSELQPDGQWGEPQNAGAVINTPEDEAFPTISPNGQLFFSSKGGVGMGGYDIFAATGVKNQWKKPENMRYPLNSPGDDFHLVTDNNGNGFFSSDRTGGLGSDDIYTWHVPAAIPDPPVHRLRIPLLVHVCPPYRDACIYLYNRNSGNGWCFSARDGSFTTKLEPASDYVIRIVTARGRDSIAFTTKGMPADSLLEKHLCPDSSLKKGSVFILRQLYYDYDRSNIRPDAAVVLDSLAMILRTHPGMRIELGAHTDSRGSAAYNLRLSQARAQAAKDYLVMTARIAASRVIPKGYGDTQPVNDCGKGVPCGDAKHEENRRTEVKILHE